MQKPRAVKSDEEDNKNETRKRVLYDDNGDGDHAGLIPVVKRFKN